MTSSGLMGVVAMNRPTCRTDFRDVTPYHGAIRNLLKSMFGNVQRHNDGDRCGFESVSNKPNVWHAERALESEISQNRRGDRTLLS